MLSRCCPGNSLILAQTDVLELGFLCSRLALYCPLFTITFRFRPIEAFSGTPSEAPLLTAVSMGFSITSSSEDTWRTPTSFPGLFPSCGGRPPREGKSPGNEVPILVINYHVHMIPIQRVNIRVLLERCLILNNLYFKGVTPITMKYSP